MSAEERKTAMDLNPDAGSHPVPDDPREFEAALRAAEEAWNRFPYLALRYGERGRRFTDSDGAWLATLAESSAERVTQQTGWLASVLAARGLPTLILSTKLAILARELTAAVPDQSAGFARLAAAGQQMDAVRDATLPPEARKGIEADFEAHAAGLLELCPGAGELITCAAADEAIGYPNALSSLLAWLANPEAFPPAWVHAVQCAVEAARRAIQAG